MIASNLYIHNSKIENLPFSCLPRIIETFFTLNQILADISVVFFFQHPWFRLNIIDKYKYLYKSVDGEVYLDSRSKMWANPVSGQSVACQFKASVFDCDWSYEDRKLLFVSPFYKIYISLWAWIAMLPNTNKWKLTSLFLEEFGINKAVHE